MLVGTISETAMRFAQGVLVIKNNEVCCMNLKLNRYTANKIDFLEFDSINYSNKLNNK